MDPPTPPSSSSDQSAQRFRAAFDQNFSGMALVAPDGTLQLLNDALCRMLGYTQQELLGKTSRHFTHPDDRERDAASIAKLVRGEIPSFTYDKRYVCKAGNIILARVSASAMRDSAGNVTEIFAVVDDVTAQRHADAAQAASEHRVRLILDHVTDHAIFMLHPDGRIAEWNAGSQRLFGYTDAEVLGKDAGLLWTPEDRAAGADKKEQQTAIDRGCALDRRWHVRKDGSRLFVDGSLQPIRDSIGALTGFVKICRDITEQQRNEQALSDARTRLDAALSAGEIGTWVWDIPHDLVYADKNLAALFGLPESTHGLPIAHYHAAIHPNDLSRVEQILRRCVAEATPYEAEYRVLAKTPAGTVERWIHARGRPETDASGKTIRFPGVVLDITARKRAEADRRRLSGQLDLFAGMLETIRDPVYIFSLDGRFLFVNNALLALWGVSREQALGKSLAELNYPPDLITRIMQDLHTVAITRLSVSSEVHYHAPVGTAGHYEYIFSPILAPDGSVSAIAGISREVTERKRSQERASFLIALDDATRPLIDPDAITQACARLLAEHLNADRCAYADVESDQDTFNLTGDYHRNVPSIVGRYTFTQFGDECLRLMHEGVPYVVTDSETDPRTEAVRASYRMTQIRAVICVPLLKEGRFVAAMAVHQATPRTWTSDEIRLVQSVASRAWESIERARVTRALRESETYFRELAETMPQIVWTARPDGTLDYVNRRWFDYTHFLPTPAEQIPWADAVHPDDRETLEHRWTESITKGAPFSLEFRIRRHDGRYRWFLARALPVRTAAGIIRRWLGTCTDIHDAKLLQHQNELLLDSERAARSAAESAQQRAEIASSAKDRFIAALSHELRTPLAPVLLALATLQHDPRLHPAFQPDLQMVRRNLDLEIRMIDDLLDLSRIKNGKLRLAIEPQHVHDLLRHAIAITASDVAAKRLRLEVRLDSPADTVLADAARLQQVFWNLIRNAVKFTPEGGVITIATSQPDSLIRVTVTDTGIGIRHNLLPRLFDAFEQGDASVTQQFGGLGLGLSISKAIIDAHQGTIAAASPGLGKGSTFTVDLPLAPAEAAREKPRSLPPETAARQLPRTARILLVEDHDDTGKTLSRLLRTTGYTVEWANSRESALQLAAASPFDLVISDIGLPDATGYDLMRELKARYALRGIALSGYGMEEDIRKSRDAGFDDHLVKPVDFDRLVALLHQLLP